MIKCSTILIPTLARSKREMVAAETSKDVVLRAVTMMNLEGRIGEDTRKSRRLT